MSCKKRWGNDPDTADIIQLIIHVQAAPFFTLQTKAGGKTEKKSNVQGERIAQTRGNVSEHLIRLNRMPRKEERGRQQLLADNTSFLCKVFKASKQGHIFSGPDNEGPIALMCPVLCGTFPPLPASFEF